MTSLPRATMALFNPRSIAVVGASANPERFTGRIVPALLRHGFAGDIYPVNPKRTGIAGLPCYPTVADLPETVDCVIYGLGPGSVLQTLEDCAGKSVGLFFIASAGFAETGTEHGIALQAQLANRARDLGIRILGPNCIGFANFHSHIAAAAAAAMQWPGIPAGDVGLAAQSGGLSFASVIYCGLSEGTGFSHIISTGNEADLDAVECAEALLDDPDTHSIALIIEAVRDAPAFLAFLRRAGEIGKPVTILKTGRSSLGKVMAASHTGALAGASEVFDMVCRRYGAAIAEDIDELFRLATMFARLRQAGKLKRYQSPGAHVASFCLSGGHVGLTADHGSLAGLQFPALPANADQLLSDALGFDIHAQNPLDTTAQVVGDDAFWGHCAEIFAGFDDIQVVLPTLTCAQSYGRPIHDIGALAARSDKIMMICWPGGSFDPDDKALMAHHLLPYFPMPRHAARGIAALDAWCRVWNTDARPAPVTPQEAPAFPATRQALLSHQMQTATSHSTALSERAAKSVLAQIGITTSPDQICTTKDEAIAAANTIGYPVVIKGDTAAILHKSDAGLVALNLADADAVATAFETLKARINNHADAAILVQPMIRFDHELILGAQLDPEFGPVVVLGMGGIFVEIMRDSVFRLAPVDHDDAVSMIHELRAAAVLLGARGTQPVNIDALSDIIVRFSQFLAENADLIAETDINPLVVTKTGDLVALDGLIVLTNPEAQTL